MIKKSFITGTLILMLAGLLVRALGFFYRIYLSNLIGAEGMGLFQLISPVYSLVILTLTSGISIAVSKMVAEQHARGDQAGLRKTTFCALVIVVSAGFIVSLLMYMYLGFITDVILKDPRTRLSMMLLIPTIPVIAASSSIKGYFYGIQDVTPTAVSQFVEQLVRIGLVILMAGYFVQVGLEYACALAVVGMAAGEISNLLYVAVVYLGRNKRCSSKADNRAAIYGNTVNRSKTTFHRKISLSGMFSSYKKIVYRIMEISIPVSINRFILSIMGAVEVILIPRRLVLGGLDYHITMQEYGKLTGMALPLIFFPSFITSSLATNLVPVISEALSVKNYKTVNYRISKSIQFTAVMGFIFTAVFMSFPHQIGNLVYRKEKIGDILYLLAFTCVFVYLQQTFLGILNGMGKQGVLLRNSVIGSVIRIGFVYYAIPHYGVKGYVWGIIAAAFAVCILNTFTIVRLTGMNISIGEWFLKPAAITFLLVMVSKYFYYFYQLLNLGNVINVILSVVTEILVALFLMILFGVLDKSDILRFSMKK